MSAPQGRDLRVQLRDGDAWRTVAGLRTKRIALGSTPVDATHSASGGWTALVDGAGVRSLSVTGKGAFRNAPSDARLRGAFFAQEQLECRLVVAGFGTVTGPFLVTRLAYGGDFDGEAEIEITLSSAGEPAFADPETA